MEKYKAIKKELEGMLAKLEGMLAKLEGSDKDENIATAIGLIKIKINSLINVCETDFDVYKLTGAIKELGKPTIIEKE